MTALPPAGPDRFGVFLAPFHRTGRNPTAALQDDLDLMVQLDRLGFDEAWIGEHHSGGWEIVGSPEVFIATAAERTRHLRFGTGVSSLPYHQPLMLADRMVLLDHITRGRTMLGVGPGALPSDAYMMGVDVARQRDMMEEALEAILALLRGDEPVTMKSDWFQLRDARLQLRPYSKPCFDVAVSSAVSPSGPRLAGRFGCGLLSFGATQKAGFNALAGNWDIMEQRAEQFGTTVDRRSWRVVGPMHLAETREQAIEDVRFGLADWVSYFAKVAALPLAPAGDGFTDLVDAAIDSGFAVIGTPDDAEAQIRRLAEQTGGFGTYMLMAHDWADAEATRKSYDLFGRAVLPRFGGTIDALRDSQAWVADNRAEFMGAAEAATQSSFRRHETESAAR
ncbi:MAG TPA: LLM class flavin-dependent oxidoreductase [Pseudonocardiaceae bacterium]|jgi:limonene 1,2-monooxygenase|nr:LLM class flavin-dependent oxidoreductase [Pseudonocardiaceae bacterium]